ncbi:hypothetical protein [Promicromonospora kroppenstedtii]|uniref:hypothetical protein n=1 Tax=Promicromonospora kroppenstedtii TaxID=440482 RepID=UPI0004B611E4|nr:hypothetical protein [Promicromonospora kroppenstedtii]
MIRAVYGLGFADLHALLETLDDDEHREAIEADLIALGLRLRHAGTDALAWHELYAVIRHLPAPRPSTGRRTPTTTSGRSTRSSWPRSLTP